MKWLLGIVCVILLVNGQFVAIFWLAMAYGLDWFMKQLAKPSDTSTQSPHTTVAQDWSNLSTSDLADLVLLKLELQRLDYDSEQQAELNQRIDALLTRYFADLNALPDNALWQKRRAAAWDLLNQYSDTPLGLPPWQPIQKTSFIKSAEFSESVVPEASISSSPTISDLTPEFPATDSQPAQFAIDEADYSATVLPTVATEIAKSGNTFKQYAWQAPEPSRLERVLSTLSGWHSLAVPFLVQNIGWFIGVFCFIAGSMFLVSYSSGYIKNLIAFFSFFIFTLALLFGGYQLRYKRPELVTSSYVLFMLSVLLIPLTNLAATQLLLSSQGLGLQLLSAVLVLVELGVFYFAVTLVSGVLDRSLQQRLPQFFLALTTTQLLQLLLIALPVWQLLAVIHLAIFALLSVAIYLFARQWLQSIFVEQKATTYFAAGTLIYSALVAFVFNTVANSIALPNGYYGFFLMLLCGLLFFVDAQLKHWLEQHAYLSRFSFLVYGLSVLALCLVAQYQVASILTLLLAIGLYGFIVWNYLTLTPLTIFLVCCFWLYSVLILQYLPAASHFLASLPLLLGLYRLANWALKKRQSGYLALIVYRVLYGLLATLTVWSLAYSEPSILAMFTAIMSAVLIYYALKAAPKQLFNQDAARQNLLYTVSFYLIPILATVTVFYTPRLFGLDSAAQFAFGLLLLATVWCYLGVRAFFNAHSTNPTIPIVQRLNSGLCSLLVALLPLLVISNGQRISVLLLAGSIALWLSYQLLALWLFYAVLLLWSAAFALLKITFFPAPSSGLASLLLGMGLWFWLWHLDRDADSELNSLRREQISQQLALLPNCRVLGGYELPRIAMMFRELTQTPLEQSMIALWLLGMFAIVGRVLDHQLSYALLASLLVASALSKLLVIRYLWIRWFALPMLLGLAALLMLLKVFDLTVDSWLLATVLYALMIWRFTVYSLAQPLVIKLSNALNPFLLDEKERIVQVIHNTAFCLVLLSSVWQVFTSGLVSSQGAHSVTVLLTLLATGGFFWLSDRASVQVAVRYSVLGCALLLVIEALSLTLHAFSWQTLSHDAYAGLLLSLLALAVATLTIRNSNYTKPAASIAIFLAGYAVWLQIYQLLARSAIIIPLDYTVLCMAGLGSLFANRMRCWQWCNLSALLVLVLAVLWLVNSVQHPTEPFNVWLGANRFVDLWWVLGIISLVLSLLARRYTQLPFDTIAGLTFNWTLLGVLTLFFTQQNTPLALLGLLLGLIAVVLSITQDTELRSVATISLVSLVILGFFSNQVDGLVLQTVLVVWAYLLWLSKLCITYPSVFAPWLGWWLLLVSPICWQQLIADNVGIYGLELFGYSLLMLRYSTWQGFVWLAALIFLAVGVAFNFDHEYLPMNLLLWSNGQLLLVNIWQRNGKQLAQRWLWQQTDLASTFANTVQWSFIGYLLLATVMVFTSISDSPQDKTLLEALPVGFLLAVSLLHLVWLRFSLLALHSLIYTVLLVLWAIYTLNFHTLFQTPLFLALWGVLLLAVRVGLAYLTRHVPKVPNDYSRVINTAVYHWLRASVILATLTLLTYSQQTLAELLLALAIIASLSAVLGGRTVHSVWLVAASIECLLLLHGWPLLLVGDTMPSLLLPWYALQSTLLAVGASWLLKQLLAKPSHAEYQAYYQQALNGTTWLMVLGVLELGGHGLLISQTVIAGASPQWLSLLFDRFAALGAGVMITLLGVHHVRRLPNSYWIYGIVLLVGALGCYGRLVWLGAVPVSLWDTAVLIVFAYSLFFLQRFFPSMPLFNSALFMPVLALLTVPLQLAAPETSLTLMLTGLLYVLMRRATQQKTPLYLALLAFNVGVYLWVPSWVQHSQLLQLYVIPAALSVLLLLQLHSRELKPNVLMGSRLMAISSIYACATVDVFLRSELSIFILAMGLSLAGILLGIALRTRAFLYAGVSFLLLNVIGQLVRFYPEQRLGKAIILMVMGAIITSLMIWFNMQRVIILQRIHAIRAEMQDWE
jgi:hypothetical protein